MQPYGFQPMNIVAADSLTDEAIGQLVAEHAPDIEVRAELESGQGAYAIDRAREIIAWQPLHSWRDPDPTT